MSKPLELTVYPRDDFGGYEVPLSVWSSDPGDDPDGFYSVSISADDARQHSGSKRLTDDELAAEYHQIEKEAWCLVAKESISKERDRELSERVDEMSATALRFATLPHYDEDQP